MMGIARTRTVVPGIELLITAYNKPGSVFLLFRPLIFRRFPYS